MEVKCISCGLFFSVDDVTYKGEYENFCSVKCQIDRMNAEQAAGVLNTDDTEKEFKWELPGKAKDG
jgi:hypothetical protein